MPRFVLALVVAAVLAEGLYRSSFSTGVGCWSDEIYWWQHVRCWLEKL